MAVAAPSCPAFPRGRPPTPRRCWTARPAWPRPGPPGRRARTSGPTWRSGRPRRPGTRVRGPPGTRW
ncbi:hypothetical protein GEV43_21845 [Actinomadura sp. J1-007]|nr:hypothetical protein [Actinomadura sp. J1-007]